MADGITILVGTAGQGVMRSVDGGQSWRRVGITQGIHSDAVVRCLTPVPGAEASVLAGCDVGIIRSDDNGDTWRRIDTPMNDTAVWAIAFDPNNPQVGFAGTGTPNPCQIYRTKDGGATWELCPVAVAAECPAVGVPRVTGIAIDPTNGDSVWVGIEVDGLRHSSDGGDTWETVPHRDIPNLDIHNVTVTSGPPHRVVVMVNDDVFLSDDDGDSWRNLDVRQNFPLGYPRGIKVQGRRPADHLHHLWRHHARLHRRRDALRRRRRNVGQPPPAGGTQHRHVGSQLPAAEPRLPPRRQPLRLPLPVRRRRRVLAKIQPRVQRNLLRPLVPQLRHNVTAIPTRIPSFPRDYPSFPRKREPRRAREGQP